jgi:uncharacterized membrane protein YtjA (UPF0391 family)
LIGPKSGLQKLCPNNYGWISNDAERNATKTGCDIAFCTGFRLIWCPSANFWRILSVWRLFCTGTSSAIEDSKKKGVYMLGWTLMFLIIALIAGILGFMSIAGAAAGIAKILFIIFLVLFVASFIGHLLRRG